MMRALIIALLLTACATDYRLGDISTGIISMQAEYCATADPAERALRLAALRAAGVPIPPSGACADIIALVPQVGVDMDETQADRDRHAVPE